MMIKKFIAFIMTALLCAVLAVPAGALENDFGGYWRTRAFAQKGFTGNDSENQDLVRVDTRTRIFYTAAINDNLKLVNEFEMDAVWGSSTNPDYGDISTDGMVFEIKNTYADFNVGYFNFKLGAQPAVIGRGFLFDEDFTGATVTLNYEGLVIPVLWMKVIEGGIGSEQNKEDYDYYAVTPTFAISDTLSVSPYFLWQSREADFDDPDGAGYNTVEVNSSIVSLGVDIDATMGAASLWFTGIIQSGEEDTTIYALAGTENEVESYDYAGFLYALGGSVDLGTADIHGEVIYASGPGRASGPKEPLEHKEFVGPMGQSYYWAEIMGKGVFDNQVSNNSPADAISNIVAVNLGTCVSLNEKMTLDADVWYAQLEEENEATDDSLGTEIDLKLTYELFDGLDLDVIAAYLFAGEVTTANSASEEDPYEVGTRLSLKF